MGLSAARLQEGFRALHGETIASFVGRRRLERARDAVLHGNAPIKQIAADAGYAHVSNFTTAFRRAFGVPPARMRREHAGRLAGR